MIISKIEDIKIGCTIYSSTFRRILEVKIENEYIKLKVYPAKFEYCGNVDKVKDIINNKEKMINTEWLSFPIFDIPNRNIISEHELDGGFLIINQ